MSDFAVLEQKLAAFQASLGAVKKTLNADTDTDSALSQLKATMLNWTHNGADTIQTEITNATKTARSTYDFDQFRENLFHVRGDVKVYVEEALDKTYDQAQQLVTNLDSAGQDALCTFMGEATQMARDVLDKMNSFIDDAGKNPEAFLSQADEKTTHFFSALSSFIDNYQFS
jgi:hypothetical protein